MPGENNIEPLLSEEEKRYVIFPIKYPEIWKMYKKAEANFWTAEELDLTKDIKDFQIKMGEGERYFQVACYFPTQGIYPIVLKLFYTGSKFKIIQFIRFSGLLLNFLRGKPQG